MNFETFVVKLMGYYKGQYSPERIEQLKRFSRSINEVALDDVYNSIIENREKDGAIAVVDIKKACQDQGVAYTESHYIPTTDVSCDACGNQFKYHPAPSDDDKIDKAIFDICPMCGFQPVWTMDRARYKIIHGWHKESEDIYQAHIEAAITRYGPVDRQFPDRKGIYFDRNKARKDREEAKEADVKERMEELGKSKRWDLPGDLR